MPNRGRLFNAWCVSVAISALVFSALPGIDLAASRLFWDGAGFPLAKNPTLHALRVSIWFLALAVPLAAMIGVVIAGLTGRSVACLSARCWAFLLSVNLLGPGLVVNMGLKSYWGRARPDQVEVFGGAHAFTPALMPTDQCLRNCSFTSGEAAASLSLAIAVLVFAHRWRGRVSPAVIVAACAVALVGGGLRVAVGRHFLSDVVFSWLIVIGVVLAVDQLLRRWKLPAQLAGPDTGMLADT